MGSQCHGTGATEQRLQNDSSQRIHDHSWYQHPSMSLALHVPLSGCAGSEPQPWLIIPWRAALAFSCGATHPLHQSPLLLQVQNVLLVSPRTKPWPRLCNRSTQHSKGLTNQRSGNLCRSSESGAPADRFRHCALLVHCTPLCRAFQIF